MIETICDVEVDFKPLSIRQHMKRIEREEKDMLLLYSATEKALTNKDGSPTIYTAKELQALKRAQNENVKLGYENITKVGGKKAEECDAELFISICDELFGKNG